MHTILEIKNIDVSYKQQKVLENGSLTLKESTLTALLGRNGSGKSTLLNTISGFLKPTKGEISVSGVNIYKSNPATRARLISYLESTPLSPQNITVKELVAFGRYPYLNLFTSLSEKDLTIINFALFQCGLSQFSDRLFNELSDGEKQKVFIARAIAQNTPLIILDEPTSHLDFIARRETIKLLKTLCLKENKTILFSSHEPELCIELADRFVITANHTFSEVNKGEVLKTLINSY
ncbi:MAG: ABC transporter ATP-binding protein [Flavobacteriales bacterium]|nr:ABC transporter ATP-binding protein [Flavobacteriales bacterium]